MHLIDKWQTNLIELGEDALDALERVQKNPQTQDIPSSRDSSLVDSAEANRENGENTHPILGSRPGSDADIKDAVKSWMRNLKEEHAPEWKSFSHVGELLDEVSGVAERELSYTAHRAEEDEGGIGTILFGPSGTGKSVLVKSLAKDIELPFFGINSTYLKHWQLEVSEK